LAKQNNTGIKLRHLQKERKEGEIIRKQVKSFKGNSASLEVDSRSVALENE